MNVLDFKGVSSLLNCSAVPPSVDLGSDSAAMIDLLVENGLGGALYHSLGASSALTDPLRQKLRPAYKKNVVSVLFAEKSYKTVESTLLENKISFIPLKGLVFRYLLYDDPAARISADLDLLVKPKDYQKAHRSLIEAGFECVGNNNRRPHSAAKFFERVYSHPFIKVPGSIVEIHRGFSQDVRYSINYHEMWHSALRLSEFCERIGARNACHGVFDDDVYFMSPEDAVVHQFVHNCIHMFNVPLHSMLDLSLMIEKWRPNWEVVVRKTSRAGLNAGAYYTLLACKETFKGNVPDKVLEAVRPRYLRKNWLDMFLSPLPVVVDYPEDMRTSFYRYSHARRVQQLLIGLPLIDGVGTGIRYSLVYAVDRLRDLLASSLGER